MSDYVIQVESVSKSFGKGDSLTRVLDGASLYIRKGEFVSLMGASGSGKSTLLYLIGGLDRNFEGTIGVSGYDIAKMKEKELTSLRLERIGFVFQFYNLVQNLNVEDNILLPSAVKGMKPAEQKKRLEEVLALTGLTDKRKAMPAQLSGGQQQRVAIARAIFGEPEIILADEPTGNLDVKSTQEVMELFTTINKEKGITILQVTHSPECASYGNRIVRLVDGKTIDENEEIEETQVKEETAE